MNCTLTSYLAILQLGMPLGYEPESAILRCALVFVGLCAMALVHELYDVFSGGWLGLALVLLSFLVFVGYTRSADKLVGQMQAYTVSG